MEVRHGAPAAIFVGANAAALVTRCVDRQAVYVFAALDRNPRHPALDKSCMAEAQGPYRYARGHAHADELVRRNGGTPNHPLQDVPGIGP